MPLTGLRTNGFHVNPRGGNAWRVVLVMVVEPRQAFEVAEVVVERVAVAMVDVMAGRNVAVSHLPNLLMETPDATSCGHSHPVRNTSVLPESRPRGNGGRRCR